MAANADPNKSAMAPAAAAIPSEEELPVVMVSQTGHGGVVVKWDDGDETLASLDTSYTGPGFSFSVERDNGNEPRVKTFGSLLRCDGGVLIGFWQSLGRCVKRTDRFIDLKLTSLFF